MRRGRGCRQSEGWHLERPFSRRAKRFPAGCQYREIGALREQSCREPGSGIQDVLTIVQKQQQFPGLERVHQRLRARLARLLADFQRCRNRLRYQAGIGKRR